MAISFYQLGGGNVWSSDKAEENSGRAASLLNSGVFLLRFW